MHNFQLPNSFPKETPFFIDGPSGKLEAAIDLPKQVLLTTIAIICHPHPLHGGTMHNKVVTTLSRALTQMGMIVLRFNYRGVGQSEGSYGHFTGEQEDLQACIHFMKEYFPSQDFWLAGFSFGSYIAAKGAEANAFVKQLITVAPAVNHVDFYGLKYVTCPWLVIQGQEDELVPTEEVVKWADAFSEQITLKILPKASHFFHGQLVALRECVIESLLCDNIGN